MALQADPSGFLMGGQPINPSRPELAMLQRLRDDVRAIRRLLEDRKNKSGNAQGGGRGVGTALPR
jgi:hypothetical protein